LLRVVEIPLDPPLLKGEDKKYLCFGYSSEILSVTRYPKVKKNPPSGGGFFFYFAAGGIPLPYCSIRPLIWMPVALVGSISMYFFQYGNPLSGFFKSMV